VVTSADEKLAGSEWLLGWRIGAGMLAVVMVFQDVMLMVLLGLHCAENATCDSSADHAARLLAWVSVISAFLASGLGFWFMLMPRVRIAALGGACLSVALGGVASAWALAS
jgi:hypothetical protein